MVSVEIIKTASNMLAKVHVTVSEQDTIPMIDIHCTVLRFPELL